MTHVHNKIAGIQLCCKESRLTHGQTIWQSDNRIISASFAKWNDEADDDTSEQHFVVDNMTKNKMKCDRKLVNYSGKIC